MKLKNLFLIASLFTFSVLNASVTNIKIHENASDRDTDGWYIYDKYPSGAKVENINDPQRGRVIKFTGTELKNGVNLLGWETPNNLIQWKMKSNQWSAFYVVIQTNNGFRYLTYTSRTPNDPKNGIDSKKKYKIRFGLGHKMQDGNWHTFTRDVKADLKKYEPNNEFIQIDGIKFRGTASFDDIKTMKETTTPPTKKKEIIIIGPSTVHIGKEWNNASKLFCETNNPENILVGWAEKFQDYSKSKVYDFARAGSNPVSFDEDKNYDNKYGKNQNWDKAYSAIQNAPKGSFLLIQFGANSGSINQESFNNKLNKYVNAAKDNELIPVLLTSVDAHNTNQTARNTTKMNNFQKAHSEILFLDLVKKSNDEFNKLNQEELDMFGDCQTYKWSGALDERKDPIHLSPNGANIVAGWVKDLACESNRADGKELCSQFK